MAAASTSKFARYLNSETGPKTIHFWAPVMKWGLVIAGINDIQRPVEKISGTQQIALFATGAIWTRWCMIIKPKNFLLASVNFFLGTVAGYQLSRVYRHQKTIGFTGSEAVLNIIKGQTGPSQAKLETPATVEASS